MPLRETRRFKTKGFAISFGDIMLPLVGFVAIALLAVAGKFFFFPELQDRPPLPAIDGPLYSPQPEKAAQAAEKNSPLQNGDKASSVAASTKVEVVSEKEKKDEGERRVLADQNLLLAIPYESRGGPSTVEPLEIVVSVPQTISPRPASPSPPGANTRNPTPRPVLKPLTVSNPRPQPVAVNPKPVVAQPQPSKKEDIKAETKAPEPERLSWMVQVGAFSTRSAADAFSEKVSNAGYSVSVASGKTLHRVLVRAGPTKDEAVKLATRMNQSGFQGAFIVPPR